MLDLNLNWWKYQVGSALLRYGFAFVLVKSAEQCSDGALRSFYVCQGKSGLQSGWEISQNLQKCSLNDTQNIYF